MDKKLTLSLSEKVIENAKSYAKENQISLSRLIENYLRSITDNETEEISITPLVKKLSGVIQLPNDFDIRENYIDYLVEKYK